MIRGLVLVAALAACASAPAPREPFSTTALLIDAQGYVASRYEPHELPAALIADLTAQDFQCHHSATMSECSSALHAFASCFDVIIVQINAEIVSAVNNRHCMGAQP
ncbi:hypothetical protein [Candidatus Viadribacter manganicus]|uniref:Lipoprotein n=1 Tax=Candidatus Viadribacter manganicus TaxID=1759059 RepID=A0A1B1AF75_9PROT|nr:hypothetical protein [Candidatus Viadribacter manganicus]ANP45226.1 hypothetical protein ATE48_04480 [Candidatus Viadribacter manganicus]